ncbi:MAG: glutamate-1-semialdehyde 2,1-aminomutase [Candidatus Hydrogenedentes bacterium]|nr:glutamate-1-semialdehyde 2,1-aminomutase [Candidatus Hydrogenedentota bacterium]
MKSAISQSLWKEANRVLVGGVNSPVRAFKGVGGDPFFAASGKGARVIDVDGNELIDYVLSWGPLILGHAHPRVTEAVRLALEKGSSFGIPTEAEIRLAERIVEIVPSIEKVRLVNSGTEATMSAIRLARGYTGRDLIIKLEGCYHGHADGLLVKAGSGLTTLGVPTSPGVPAAYASCTLTMPYNDLDAARALFEAHGENIAAIILEPVPGNMGVVLPEEGYLQALRDLTATFGALLIFDEVMSGFRVAMGGAQAHYNVIPDLTVLGKVIGGGLPVGAYGGSEEIMDRVSPVGPIYQAGTLSGNPLATAAGIATLDVLEEPGVFNGVVETTKKLGAELGVLAREAGIPVFQTQLGTMSCLFFHEGPIKCYTDATASDTKRYAKFFWAMLERGVYLAPSQYEAAFTSIAHGPSEIDQTLSAAKAAFAAL